MIYQLVFIQKDVIREIKLTKDNWTLYRAYQNEVKNVCVFGNYDTEDLLRNKNKLIEKEKGLQFEYIETNQCLIFIKCFSIVTVSLGKTEYN